MALFCHVREASDGKETTTERYIYKKKRQFIDWGGAMENHFGGKYGEQGRIIECCSSRVRLLVTGKPFARY